MTEDAVRESLARYDGPELRLMEVCGSHTAAIAKNGISDMLSPRIRLISGPGCPVCVTPTAYIDRLISLAETPGCAEVVSLAQPVSAITAESMAAAQAFLNEKLI